MAFDTSVWSGGSWRNTNSAFLSNGSFNYSLSSGSPSYALQTPQYSYGQNWGAAMYQGAGQASNIPVVGSFFQGFQMGYKGVADIANIFLSFRAAKQEKEMHKLQAEIYEIQRKQYISAAEGVLRRGNQEVAAISYRSGQVKAATRVAQASSGVQLRTGNAAEVMTSHEIAKEMQVNQTLANAVTESFGYRSAAVDMQNKALVERATAKNISPWAVAITSAISVLANPQGATDNPLMSDSQSTGSGSIDNWMSIGKGMSSLFGGSFGSGGGMSGGGMGG